MNVPTRFILAFSKFTNTKKRVVASQEGTYQYVSNKKKYINKTCKFFIQLLLSVPEK